MKIYINNEEVLCASKMDIKESLKNTSSVILNNVYPKSWENDKDYVSRFYMPKDYSHCKIIDENITTTSEVDLSNNILYLQNRNYNTNYITYQSGIELTYIKVIPGKEYKLNVNNESTSGTWLCQANSLKIGSYVTFSQTIPSGESTITITPTKKYIFAYHKFNTYNHLTFNSVKIVTDDNLIFSGMVKNSGKIELNPRYPHYSTLQLLDYKAFLSEGDTLSYVLESQSISSAIKRVLKDVDGFMVGELKINDEIIAPYNCNDKTIYDVFEYLAEISNSIWFTKAINDKLVLINFYSEGNLRQANTIEYEHNYFQENNIQDISYSYNTKDYRNKQVIISDKASSGTTQIEYLTYNGNELKTTYPVEKVVSITSGSSNYSVSTKQAQQNGTYASFYYSYNSNDIDVNRSFETGKVFKVTYYSVVTTRQAVYNQKEIDRISETTSRNGILARYEKRTDTTDNEALNQIAQSYLNYKGTPEIILTIKTYNKDIFNIGDRVLFNGPLESLTTNYLVLEKTIQMVTTQDQQEIFYIYKLSSSFNDESAINFFDNQRRKLEGNITEGQYITRYIDIPSETNIIFYDLSKSELQIPNDILDGELDVELIGSIGNNTLNSILEFKL